VFSGPGYFCSAHEKDAKPQGIVDKSCGSVIVKERSGLTHAPSLGVPEKSSRSPKGSLTFLGISGKEKKMEKKNGKNWGGELPAKNKKGGVRVPLNSVLKGEKSGLKVSRDPSGRMSGLGLRDLLWALKTRAGGRPLEGTE